MSKDTLYNYTGALTKIYDEGYRDVGASAFKLGTSRRLFVADEFNIEYGDSGGADLIKDTDYELTGLDAYYTDKYGANVYTSITILNAAYQTGDLWITYNCAGSLTDAAQINTMSSDIDTLQTNVAALTGQVPTGTMFPYAGVSAPSGFLLCNGAAVSKTTYSALFAIMKTTKGTCTISNANPCVVTCNDHGLATGDVIYFTTSAADLPASLAENTNYWVVYNDANSFWIASSWANALAGTKIATTDAGSGTHTLHYAPYGISGATNFLLPDARGVTLKGAGQQGTAGWAAAAYSGGIGHYRQDQAQSHIHTIKGNNGGSASSIAPNSATSTNLSVTYSSGVCSSPVTDGSYGTPRAGSVNEMASMGVNYIIKT